MEIFAYVLLVFALAFLAWTIFKRKGGDGCSCSGTCAGGGCCKRQRREGGEREAENPRAGK